MNKLLLALFCVFWTTFLFSQQTYEVNLSGNAYVTSFRDGATITQSGLKKWISEKSVIETFIYFHKPETISISIKGIAESESVIEISFQRKK